MDDLNNNIQFTVRLTWSNVNSSSHGAVYFNYFSTIFYIKLINEYLIFIKNGTSHVNKSGLIFV